MKKIASESVAGRLTKEKEYEVNLLDGEHCYVIDDRGVEWGFCVDFFYPIEQRQSTEITTIEKAIETIKDFKSWGMENLPNELSTAIDVILKYHEGNI